MLFRQRAVRIVVATACLGWLLNGTGCASRPGEGRSAATLRKALTFHAPFDRSTDAAFATSDPWIYHAPAMNKWTEAKPGLPAEGVVLAPTEGRYGGALRFTKKSDAVVFYRGAGNVPWKSSDWSGTVSFWLRVDQAALAKGFADPVQITPRAWNDAAFFVEFEKRETDIPFRLGAYADYKVWNPRDRKWEQIPAAEKPLVTVPGPPFAGDRWTHVAFTWRNFNTGRPDGEALLFLDGAQVGALRQRTQTFTWDDATRILLGVSWVGVIDDLAVFHRALSMEELQVIRRLPRGIASLSQP